MTSLRAVTTCNAKPLPNEDTTVPVGKVYAQAIGRLCQQPAAALRSQAFSDPQAARALAAGRQIVVDQARSNLNAQLKVPQGLQHLPEKLCR